MYKIITQDKFRQLMNEYINKSCDAALFGMDVIYPLLEKLKFDEALPLMSGYGGLINTIDILSSNIDLVIKDKMVDETSDVVYYLNEQGMPAKISKKEYDKMINKMETGFEGEYETGYLQRPSDEDEKMFG